MLAHIEILEGIREKSLPIIKLTKSKNGNTGTATFLFIQPEILDIIKYSPAFLAIDNLSLMWENQKIETNDLTILFFEGKPKILKGIFIFKNPREWYQFLNFMNLYSKETGLFFEI